eukprot:scaffold13528_cov126-Isochrysis_galbana.AAC.5
MATLYSVRPRREGRPGARRSRSDGASRRHRLSLSSPRPAQMSSREEGAGVRPRPPCSVRRRSPGHIHLRGGPGSGGGGDVKEARQRAMQQLARSMASHDMCQDSSGQKFHPK